MEELEASSFDDVMSPEFEAAVKESHTHLCHHHVDNIYTHFPLFVHL